MTSLHWQTSLQNRQCHALCTLGKTSRCWLGFTTNLSLWSLHGASFNVGWHCQSLWWIEALPELIMIELPGWGSYGWWQHSYVSRDLDNLNRGCVTAEVSSLTRLTNDASRHQFLAQMLKAKVSWLLCIGRLVFKTDNVMHFARLVKQAGVDMVSRPICLYGAYMTI